MSTSLPADCSSRVNRIGLVLLGIVIVVVVLARPHAPTVASVDGIYVNSCCGPIRLLNGVLIADGIRVPFKLGNMKFGLVANLAKSVRVGPGSSISIGDEPDRASILFDKDHKGFTLLRGHVTEYDFRRMQPGR